MWPSYSFVIYVFSFVSICIPVWVPISWLVLIIYLGVCEGYLRHYCDFKSQSYTKVHRNITLHHCCLPIPIPFFFLSLSLSQSYFSIETIFLYFFCTNRLSIFLYLFAYGGWYAILFCTLLFSFYSMS